MFQKLLNPDNGLMITFAQITDCIFLSMFWMVGCIPLVSIGASTAALYDAVVHAYRKGDKHAWIRFIQVYKKNWKSGVMPTVVYLAVFAVLVFGLIRIWNAAVLGGGSWMLFSGAAFLSVTVLGVLSVMFPMLSRFENSFGNLVKNTVFLALANLPRTLALGMINAVAIVLCALFVFPLFFLPALAALLGTLFIEPMFKPYMPDIPDENAAE